MDFNAIISSGCVNPELFEEMYQRYLQNPNDVDASWRQIFTQTEQLSVDAPLQKQQPQEPNKTSNALTDESRIHKLIESYRTYGHLLARTNPLSTKEIVEPVELTLKRLDFSDKELSRPFPTCGLLKQPLAPLHDIIATLKLIYCHRIGIEYMGMQNEEMEKWIQERIESSQFKNSLSVEKKLTILDYLNKSEIFETFIHTKYVGQKRFSLEGGETLIPMLATVLEEGAVNGIDEFIIGMAHRGRLNVLSNIFNKSYSDIFSEFHEGYIPLSVEGSGDVKYHKGFYSEKKTLHGHEIKLTLSPNPSHLEAVDPVVEGQVHARQIMLNDKNQEKVLPILIHGDGAVAGQGVVYETLQLCRIDGYSTGGTLHIVINNQVAFTTQPKEGRSTRYCTDIAHAFGAPVFHVDAESPEDCIYATQLAIALRQKFHCDVFIELNCYRKYGHNEGDEPFFTQPIEYGIIRAKRPIRELYRDGLIEQGILKQDQAKALEIEFKASLEKHLKEIQSPSNEIRAKEESSLAENNALIFQPTVTAVSKSVIQEVGKQLCTIPKDVTIHPKLAVLMKERLSMIDLDSADKNPDNAQSNAANPVKPIDWGMAELLAYGTLVWENKDIRLSGQDSCRGTFSHRHARLVDQTREESYVPLQHLKPSQGRFDVYNSPLSEYAVLGFEFGYSVTHPDALVIWEAQFGDFSNGAQIIIDQFIAASEQKWEQRSPLTLFLPHGYEGQGPEHSSGRIERFLTLAGDCNMQIVNPTTPSQLFHLLRRQSLRELKKPLIVFTPKGLLRHPKCVSTLKDLSQGTFQEILEDPSPGKNSERLIFCSGRIFYDLIAEREKTETTDLMIVRIEQLYPLNIEKIKEIICKLSKLKECFWVQEEPNNMGAWNFLNQTLRGLLPPKVELQYVGRARSASTAVGSHAMHKTEHSGILNAIFTGNKTGNKK